ncbi:HAD-superfamily hydrolase, subfamily IA, variant 3 [candidate division TM7 genomosp. GTL1]|nr:HAD-superfamily hydrolase, subfamily IA, variant 3 [candidate division TM7 genomosp. GTL1]
MNKAFIFDLDGVLIDDEQIWEDEKSKLYIKVFGKEVADRLGSTIGINIDGIYEKAVSCGTQIPKERLVSAFYELAPTIYQTAPIPAGLDNLVIFLKENNFVIGIVSASPLPWITTVTKRLSFENDITLIISLYDRPDLPHKPAPDGYIEAIQSLEATPASTFILEDSNAGIESAKDSGAFTIGLQQNLTKGYKQNGADAYAATARDVIEIVRQRIENPIKAVG